MTPKYPEITVQLSGQDGNAFVIIGRTRSALDTYLRKQGVSFGERASIKEQFTAEATAGDYDNVLRTVMEWVEVE